MSLLGPAAHKWKEGVAEEPPDLDLANVGLKPALQHPLPDLSEKPWWEEGQSLQKPPPVPLDPPGQYWQGQAMGGSGGYPQPQQPGPGPGIVKVKMINMIKLRGSYKLSPQDIRPQYQDPRLTIPGSSPNAFGGYGRMPGDVGGGYSYQPNQNTKDDFFSSLRSMFGQTSERPSRRYEGRMRL